MQIAINCRCFLNKNYTGIGRYAYNLINTLREIDEENNYVLYVKKGLFHHNRDLSGLRTKNFQVKIDWFKRGPENILKHIDVYHAPCPEVINFDNGVKVIVTIHDLIFKTFPQGHTESAVSDTEKQIRSICERAHRIICCSQNTVKDLIKYFSVPEKKISMVYQGVDKNMFYVIGSQEETLADAVLKSKGVDKPYILFVGTIEPRKNLKNILHAFSHLHRHKEFGGQLVVVGMKGWLSEDFEDLIKKLDLTDHVITVGFLTDQELRYFYNKAQAFVFPSYYEGFGFPIIESFCCGTPVVTSNVSSCPEVAADAALLTDPYNPQAIADSMAQIIHDQQLRRTLRDKGFKRAGDFNFLKTANKTLDVYREVLSC